MLLLLAVMKKKNALHPAPGWIAGETSMMGAPVWGHVCRQAPEPGSSLQIKHIVTWLPYLHDECALDWVVALHEVAHAVHKDVCSTVMQSGLQTAGYKQGQDNYTVWEEAHEPSGTGQASCHVHGHYMSSSCSATAAGASC